MGTRHAKSWEHKRARCVQGSKWHYCWAESQVTHTVCAHDPERTHQGKCFCNCQVLHRHYFLFGCVLQGCCETQRRSHARKAALEAGTASRTCSLTEFGVQLEQVSDHRGIVKRKLTANFSRIRSIKCVRKLVTLIKILPINLFTDK